MRKFLSSLLILFSLSTLFAEAYTPSVFTITDNTVLEKHEVDISGPWDFFWGKYVSPLDNLSVPDCQVEIPSTWDSYDLSEDAAEIAKTGKGAGTYKITINGLKPNQKYSFFAYSLAATAFTVIANGKEIYTSGRPSVNYKKTRTDQNMALVTFNANEYGIAKLTIFVSNKDYRKGGLWKSVTIEEDTKAREVFNKKIASQSLIAGILLAVVFYCLFISLLNRDKGSIFLAVFTFVLLLRLCSADFTIIKYFAPFISYSVILKFEYTVLFFGPAAYTLYLDALNPNIFKLIKAKFLALPSIIFAVFTYAAPLNIANRLVPVMELYLIIILVIDLLLLAIQAIKYDDFVSVLTLFSLLIIALGFVNDLLLTNFVKLNLFGGQKIIPWCFVIYTIFQAVVLAYMENQKQTKLEQKNSNYRIENAAYNRYIPSDALKLVTDKDITEITAEEKTVKDMMILCANIENLNVDELSNEQIFKTLNLYLEEIVPVIKADGGIIIKNSGNKITAVFPENPENALLCSIHMQEKMKDFRFKLRDLQYPAIWIGIGIHYGKVVLGTTGTENTISEFEMSRDIDIAETVEALTKSFKKQILVTKEGIALAAKNYKAAGKKFEFHGNQVNTETNKELYSLYSSTVLENM